MSLIYDVSHKTVFDYEQTVSISHHVLHLLPRADPQQTCMSASILVDPAPTLRSEGSDYFGNPVTRLMVQEPHRRLRIHARSRIAVARERIADLKDSQPWEEVAESLKAGSASGLLEAAELAFESPYAESDSATREFALESFGPGRPILDAAMALTSRIYRDFEYQGGVTDVSTPVREVLERRQGVCQDFAHLQIACLRSLGLPARYVSGYLLTHPPEGQEKLVGADASHAWVAVWSPDHGWVDFDPTNDLMPAEEHITLAWGRDYGDVSPINGFILGGGSHRVSVGVDVSPVKAA